MLVGLLVVGCGRVGYDAVDGEGATLALAEANANVNSIVALVATGGRRPYQFSIADGDGEIDAATGELVTPPVDQIVTVEVTDDAGARAEAAITVGGTTLFHAAGRDASHNATDTVWRSSDGGASWTVAGALPMPTYNGGFLVYRDAMLWIAGRPGGWISDVWSSEDGASWTLVGNLPDPRASFYPALYDGRLWIVGGYNTVTRDDVWASDDGGASWVAMGSFPTLTHGGHLLAHGGRLWHLGGWSEEEGIQFDEVWWTTDGASWTEVADVMPGSCYYMSALGYRGSIVVAGGSESPCADGVYTSVDAQSWARIGTLPAGRDNGRLVRHQGRLLYVAGQNVGGGAEATVWDSSDGITWSVVGNLPAPRYGGGLVSYRPPGE